MQKWLLGLLFLLSLCVPMAAQAAAPGVINQYNALCNPDFPTQCAKPNSSGELPISGSITATNPSVEPTGGAVPSDATYIGGNKGGTFTGATINADNGLEVHVTNGGSGGTSSTFGDPFPSLGTAVGMSDGVNMVPFFTTDGTSLDVNCITGCSGSGGTQDVNIVEIGGNAVTTTLPVSGTVTVAQGTAANLNATVVGTGTFLVQAAQSGTWTVQPGNTANTTPWLTTISQGGNSATVSAGGALKVDGTGGTFPISGTVTANQGTSPWIVAGGGTAGSPGTAVLTVQGIASGTSVNVAQGTASNLKAQVVGAGSAGTADAGVITIQGIAGMTKVLVTPDANSAVNVAQFGGTNVSTGTGTGGSGIPRVTVSSDSTLTSVGSITTAVTPGTAAANLGKAEDAGHSSGDTGVAIWSVRNDALATYAADLDYQPFSTDNSGRTLIIEAPTAAMVRGTATTTGTSDTSLVAASGSASLKTYIKSCQFVNTGGTNDALITLKDGNGGSTLAYTVAAKSYGGSNVVYEIPLVTTANTALYFASNQSSTTVYGSCQGYKAP